ncbi:hypothetical protein N1851_022920 [Merluccius polli]|uniref:Transcription factor Adf-1 n=1 Tax=Merluccius polli TaxID=89951 RepID=A0AA47NVH4_MERPO|nr:hypothetical protein N1851_022920 [Merluccius polli]
MADTSVGKVPVERLIVLVTEHVEIYDMSNRLYHNTHHKESIWRQIGLILGCPWEACQAKWKYLRDMYRRQRKDQREKKSGSEGGIDKRPWKYLGILSFLDPHVQDRETTSNYSGPQETTETAESILNAIYESGGEGTAGESEATMDDSVHSIAIPRRQPTPPPPPPPGPTRVPRRRRSQESTVSPYQQRLLETIDKEQDEHELFLLSFAPALRRLEPRNRQW